MLTPKETATVLAALRHWQDLEERLPALKFRPGESRKGTHFEEHDPLTVEEIDSLCERLTKPAYTRREMYGPGGGTDDPMGAASGGNGR